MDGKEIAQLLVCIVDEACDSHGYDALVTLSECLDICIRKKTLDTPLVRELKEAMGRYV